MEKSPDVYWHEHNIKKESRQKLHGHESFIIWFTGLSGSGKSTIANALERKLHEKGNSTYLLDGDNIRHGLNKDLAFSKEDRMENIRRIGEVAKLFIDSGLIVLTAFVSPYHADRQLVRGLVEQKEFIEVFVDCSIETCEGRDPKGLYRKARAGEIKQFTGISDPYEVPQKPEIVVNSDQLSIDACAEIIYNYLIDHGYVNQ